MSTSALILMVSVLGLVTTITVYFLVKVLRVPPKTDEELEREEKEDSLQE
ncbi:MAG: hypothetical protein IH595_04230 [Bacteroidales bacterium]|nr:hypothetical protein [Bacteroidales bacterium]